MSAAFTRPSTWLRLAMVAAIVLGAFLLLEGAAKAGDPESQFELDGDWPSATLPDWANTSHADFTDVSGVKETIIEPGNSIASSPYPYPLRANQNAGNKSDLVGAWITSVRQGDDIYLYVAAERASFQGSDTPGGNTKVIFALHQSPSVRTVGDLIVAMDFVNGGGTAEPQVLRWTGSSWELLALDPSVTKAISNTAGAVGPSGTLDGANLFVEAGVHLNAAGVLSPTSCFNATTLWVMTSSSQEVTSNLDDVINGGPIDLETAGVELSNCGSVTVEKVVEGPDNGSQWEMTVSPNVDGFTSETIGNGESTSKVVVNPNTAITVAESAVDAGLAFEATWACNNGEDGTGTSFGIEVDPFEDVVCTFHNRIDEVPTIAVTKTANPTSVNEPGGNVSYAVAVQNTSTSDSVTLTSLIDDKFGNLDGMGTCDVPQVITAGGSYSCSFTAPVNGNAGATHTNVVTAIAKDDQDNEATDNDDATVTVSDVLPSITVLKTPSPMVVNEPGGNVTFSVDVTNTSAESVTLTSLSDDQFGNLDGNGTCDVPQVIAAGATYSCLFTAFVGGQSGGQHENTVTAAASDDDGNQAQANDSATVGIGDLPSSIEVTKSANVPSVAEPGANVMYTVEVENTSATDSITVNSLSDDKFGNLDGKGTCDVPQVIAAGGSYSCSFTEFVGGQPGDVHTNVVTASAVDDDGNPLSDDDNAMVSITNVDASINVTKSASVPAVDEPGANVTFTVEVENTSSVDDVQLTSLVDSIYGNLDGVGTCDVPQVITAGGSYSCTFTEFVGGAPGTSHTNVVTAIGLDEQQNEVTDWDDETVTIRDVGSSITIIKSASPASVPETGGDVTFTFTVTNTSAVDTVELTSLVDSVFGDLDGQGTCEVPQSIAAGASYECSITEFISGNGGSSHTNVVTATGVDEQENEVEDEDDETVTITDLESSITVQKSASPTAVQTPGGSVTYTVSVTNNSAADDVFINSIVDDRFGDLDGQGTCSVPQTLSPAEVYSCTFTATVTGSGGTSHVNIVTVTGYDDNENEVSDSDDATVVITNTPPPPPPPGDPDPTPTPSPTASPTPSPTPGPEVLGSTAAIDKVLVSADPARVGELAKFRIEFTISGDTDVSQVGIVDTFEKEYLQYVSTTAENCQVLPNYPDAKHSSLACDFGDVSLAGSGAPGSETITFDVTFRALKSTLPGRTINSVTGSLDLDADGPAPLSQIGPATADLEIVEVLGLQLPPAGDGSRSDGTAVPDYAILAGVLAMATLGLTLGLRPVLARIRR